MALRKQFELPTYNIVSLFPCAYISYSYIIIMISEINKTVLKFNYYDCTYLFILHAQ